MSGKKAKKNDICILANPLAKVHRSICEIGKTSWNDLIGDNFPFLEYEFLKALEDSDSVGFENGWVPQYISLSSAIGEVIGAVPLYLKDNSMGEYIFDWSWASIYQQLGLPYYPKLVAAIPFTPATGKRILVRPDQPYREVAKQLIDAAVVLANEHRASSLHWLFTTKEEMEFLAEHNHAPRYTHQFHWHNCDYRDFDDYLQRFPCKKRNQIKRERRRANEGVEIEILTGDQLKPQHWQLMYRLYLSTIGRKWAYDYLQRTFFTYIGENFADNTVILLAKKGGKYIAGTLNFRKGHHLYGRYWGCLVRHRCLHFEMCYYRLIEYCIDEKIELFEAGAQGEQKLLRGFLPRYTYSAHWIADPNGALIIDEFLRQERRAVVDMMREYEQLIPFKTNPGEENG